MIKFNSDRELFSYVRNYDLNKVLPKIQSFKELKVEQVKIDEILKDIFKNDKYLIIDARSEKEHDESSIPKSINFPILKNQERHNVGLIYKKYSTSAAFQLALEYASEKYEILENFLKENLAQEKEIIIYCWRGGGRSKYLAKMINELGYSCKTILGGFKAYRAEVNNFFSDETEKSQLSKINLIELSGLTGVGKTEILNELKKYFPIIDLELAAHHHSSLFGNIPYIIKNYQPVKNQSAFENNIYSQILKGFQSSFYKGKFIIESESKKVGDFFIPDSLYTKIESAPCILIQSSFEQRIERIVRDYFGNNLEGLTYIEKTFKEKEKFFRKELSNRTYEELLNYLKIGEVRKFTEILLILYYDKKYKVKPKIPCLTVNSDEKEKCIKTILDYLYSWEKKF
ncbi:MAG: tRNA 2-selenouridine(34) synthase MnmH [Ignavibacteria bacterium]|nr:tRNA 2-selenouridine(34) synthase MnmH [Ignavibacteria bacterium]